MVNIPTDLLRTFVTLADIGSFTRAADLLGRSQPAISLQVKRLEEMVGASLFQRKGRNFEPTEEGELLVTYARQMLYLNDEALSRLMKPKVGGIVRVGLPNDFAVSFLPEILVNFAKLNLGVSLEVNCELSKNLLEGLQGNHFDVVIAMTGTTAASSVTKVWSERLAWIGGIESKAHKDDPVPLIVYPQGCVYRHRIINSLNRAGRAWRIVYSSPSLSGILAAVRSGLGVTVLSEKTVPAGVRIFGRKEGFPGLADVEVGLYCRQDSLPQAAVRLVNFVIASLDEVHPGPDRLVKGSQARSRAPAASP